MTVSEWRIGRFSDGQERLPEQHPSKHVGRFSTGQDHEGRPVASRRTGVVPPEIRAAA